MGNVKVKEKDSVRVVVNPQTGLTAKQEDCATSLAAGVAIADVANALGVNRATIYRWLEKPVFKCYLNRLSEDSRMFYTGRIQGLQAKAIQVFEDALESDNEAIRLKAAGWIVEKALAVPTGVTDIRDILKKECSTSLVGWDSGEPFLNENLYRERLEEMGLEE